MEAININTDIDVILDVYVKMLEITHRSRHFGMYIIYHNKHRYRVNYASFGKYIELLSVLEVPLMKDRYMNHRYRNFKKIKMLFNQTISKTIDKTIKENKHTDRKEKRKKINKLGDHESVMHDLKGYYTQVRDLNILYPRLIQYIQFANVLFSVRHKERELMKISKNIIDACNTKGNRSSGMRMDLIPYVKAELSEQFGDLTVEQFEIMMLLMIDLFIEIERIRIIDRQTFEESDITAKLSKIVDTLLENDTIEPSLILYPYTTDVTSQYHQENIRRQFPHPDMKITKYDEEMYLMNMCRGQYEDAFTTQYEIGYFRLSTRSRYKYENSYVQVDSERYYKQFLDVDINMNTKEDIDKLDGITTEYIRGMYWVFNLYMNCTDPDFCKTKISPWFYRYSHAPMLYHISKQIANMCKQVSTTKDRIRPGGGDSYSVEKKDRWRWLETLFESVSKSSYIDRNSYITDLEYYIYINPFQRLDVSIVGKTLYTQLNALNTKHVFTDLDDMIEKIWNGAVNIIDVRYMYLSRGKLINFEIHPYEQWKQTLCNNGLDPVLLSECNDSIISINNELLALNDLSNSEHILELNSEESSSDDDSKGDIIEKVQYFKRFDIWNHGFIFERNLLDSLYVRQNKPTTPRLAEGRVIQFTNTY